MISSSAIVFICIATYLSACIVLLFANKHCHENLIQSFLISFNKYAIDVLKNKNAIQIGKSNFINIIARISFYIFYTLIINITFVIFVPLIPIILIINSYNKKKNGQAGRFIPKPPEYKSTLTPSGFNPNDYTSGFIPKPPEYKSTLLIDVPYDTKWSPTRFQVFYVDREPNLANREFIENHYEEIKQFFANKFSEKYFNIEYDNNCEFVYLPLADDDI